jgi:hypothetical protein
MNKFAMLKDLAWLMVIAGSENEALAIGERFYGVSQEYLIAIKIKQYYFIRVKP